MRFLGYRAPGREKEATAYLGEKSDNLPDWRVTGVHESFYENREFWPTHPFVMAAPLLLQEHVNRRLALAHPLFTMANTPERGVTPTPTWYAPTLLSALYLQFWGDVVQATQYRQCAHHLCGKFFVAHDARQLYCCREHSIAARVWKSRHRARTTSRGV